jgi:hypothetical protein
LTGVVSEIPIDRKRGERGDSDEDGVGGLKAVGIEEKPAEDSASETTKGSDLIVATEPQTTFSVGADFADDGAAGDPEKASADALEGTKDDDVFDASDEGEAGENGDVEEEAGEKVAFGVAGVDDSTEREYDEELCESEDSSEEALDSTGSLEEIGIHSEGDKDGRVGLAAGEGGACECDELLVLEQIKEGGSVIYVGHGGLPLTDTLI